MARRTSTSFGALLPLLISAICFYEADAEAILCTEVGQFSLPDSCEEYFECRPYRGKVYSRRLLCPAGTMFDDILRECTPTDQLTSPLRCVQKNMPIEKTALGGSIVENFTICDLMNAIEGYTTLVATTPLMRESFAHQAQYNKHIAHYNRDLEKAQNNTIPWRNGDSILSGLKNVYHKANAYKGEFQRKVAINKKEIQALSTRELNQKHLDRLKKDIQSLQNEINGAQAALAVTDAAAVQQYFEGVISSKTREIERKQQQINSYSKEGLIINELTNFLGFVKDDVDKVGGLAMQWQLQLTSLLENIGSDADAYDRYAIRMGEDIKLLTKEETVIEDGLVGIVAEEERLEGDKSTLNGQLDTLNAENSEINQQVAELVFVVQNKTDMLGDLQASLCRIGGRISSLINENSTKLEVERACNLIMQQENVNLDVSAEEAQIRKLRQEAKKNRRQIRMILDRLSSITEELRTLFGSVSPQKTRLDQIKVEKSSLQSHASDLENLQTGVTTALNALVKLKEELQNLQDTFESLSSQIQSMIGQANAATSEDDKHPRRMAIEEAVDNMQLKLELLYLPDLSKC